MKSNRKLCCKQLLLTGSLLLYFFNLHGQEWQWSVKGKEVNNHARAFLWIPSDCKQVRGLVIAQHNMEEISILENPVFRKEMTKLGFAEIWVSPSPDVLKFFDFSKGAGEITDAYLDNLATVSGYDELRYVPIVGIGHSAAASWPYFFGAWNPARTLACISVSGQWPYVRGANFAPDIWKPDQNLDYIPCLETMGEYEAAATWSKEGLKERQEHPLLPLSMLAVPGEGHFASSDRKAAFIAFYIKKAVQYRFPSKKSSSKKVFLKPIDPTKTGWLADKWRLNQEPTSTAAPVGYYKGDVKNAFWYFDEETVRYVEDYGKTFRGLQPQLTAFVQNGQIVPQQNTHLQVRLKFIPDTDGITFHVYGGFYDTVPAISTRLKDWTQLPVGSGIGHSKNRNALSIEKICGPFKKINDTTFRVQIERGVDLATDKFVFTLAVKHPGDNEFKAAVQQGEMVIPSFLKEGTEQKINFPLIANQKVGIKQMTLQATSNVGLPVYYYVLDGPAELDGSVLRFTKIPPKAKFPVKVTIIAWQYGQSFEPKIKSAEPIVRVFYLIK